MGVLSELDCASITRINTHDYLEQRCFTGTIGPYERIAFPRIDLKRSAVEQNARTKAFFDFIGKQNHEASLNDVVEISLRARSILNLENEMYRA